MFTKNDKISLAIAGVEIVSCLILSAVCYAKAQYYQGRIDARREMIEVFDNSIKQLEKEIENKSKKEA